VHNLGNRRLQAEIAAIGIDAGVVREAVGMTAETEEVVGLVEVSGGDGELGLVIALEAGAGHDVENSVGAVAELRAIAAAIDFDVIQILGIELRPEILRNSGVDDRNTVEEPCGLVAAAHVEHVVGDIGSGT